jgi:predicted transcriptional regulator
MNIKVLSSIRREIVSSLINNFGLNQKEVADKLDITSSAVSQYLAGKRGYNITFDDDILEEIDISAGRIYEEDYSQFPVEVCRICKIIKTKDVCRPVNIIKR